MPDRQTKTERLEARITPLTASRIRDLAKSWGPVVPLGHTAVVTEAIHRAWMAEQKKRKKLSADS